MALFQNSALNKYIQLQDRVAIDKTDKKTDQMIYSFCGLSEEKITIVEEEFNE